jgi:hypothetical protein
MDLIDKIGPALGIAAFFGLSVLAFLLFQQSREVRRLREWAGRAPERAQEAAEASLAAAEARGEAKAGDEPKEGRFAAARHRIGGVVKPRLQAIDRRLPIDGRYVAVILLVVIVAAGVLTSGFGLVGGGNDNGKGGGKAEHQPKPQIAVLNATQSASAAPVPGLAHSVSEGVVKPLGYKVVAEDDAPAGLANTTVMYTGDFKDAADKFAKKVRPKLGDIAVTKMNQDVKANARGAKVALLVGLDDSTFGQ